MINQRGGPRPFPTDTQLGSHQPAESRPLISRGSPDTEGSPRPAHGPESRAGLGDQTVRCIAESERQGLEALVYRSQVWKMDQPPHLMRLCVWCGDKDNRGDLVLTIPVELWDDTRCGADAVIRDMQRRNRQRKLADILPAEERNWEPARLPAVEAQSDDMGAPPMGPQSPEAEPPKLHTTQVTLDDFHGHDGVTLRFFCCARGEPVLPYEQIIADWAELDDYWKHCAGVWANELLTEAEVEELRQYLREHDGWEIEVDEVELPTSGKNRMPLGAIVASGPQQFVPIDSRDNCDLSILVRAYYDLREATPR